MKKKLIAEFIGTFILSTVVLFSLAHQFTIPTPVLAGLVLGLFVFTIGSISGSHLNPAVTLGLWSIGKISFSDIIPYIVAQLFGGVVAQMLLFVSKTPIAPLAVPDNIVLLFEFIGMVVFTFGISAVVHKKVTDILSGIVIGGSLFLGITISVLGGGAGILNPAVGVALGVSAWGYYIVEIVGSAIGFRLFTYLSEKKK